MSLTTDCGYRVKFGRPLWADFENEKSEHRETDFIIFWRNWSNFATAQTCGIRAGCAHHEKASAAKLALAEVPKVDHRVRQRFECVVDFADEFESKQQALELVFPCKHALDGAKPLFKNCGIEDLFATSLGGLSATWIFVDIGRHAAIEYGFPICP